MQPATAPPRDAYTVAEVEAAITGTHQRVDAGCELLDSSDGLVADISADLVGGVVEHGNYRDIHGICRLQLARSLDWGSQRVKPYLMLNGIRFNLGVYLLSVPQEPRGESPAMFDVEGFDKGILLDQPVGETWTVPEDSSYLLQASFTLEQAGVPASQQLIDQTAWSKRTPKARAWPVSEENTWRRVITDLTDAVGYRAVWFDWDGKARLEPYRAPVDRPVEWTYDAAHESTILGDYSSRADYTDAPNRWVFSRSDPLQGLPVEDDGLYVVENAGDGLTSFEARGRWITARPTPIFINAADHASLVATAGRMVEADKRVYQEFRLTTAPNPLHWHFDVGRVVDDGDVKVAWRSWALPLDGSDMSHDVRQA